MLKFFFIFYLFLICLIPFPSQICGAAEGEPNSFESIGLEKSYQQAKFYYNELHTNTSLGNSRTNWLNGTHNFRKIYLAGPKSEFAAPSLYMLARMYAKMYERFGNQIDMQESISYYRDVSDLFSDNRLADDALYAVANIFLTEENNPEKAAKYFVRIIENHRNGDIYPLASDKLKTLSKEHGIPLPDAMLKHSYLENLSYVLPVKYWSSNNYTRVVINASGPVTYSEKLLEKQGDLPRRLYIDFKESYIEPRYRAPVPIEDGLLKQIRTGQFTPETVRVVLDIESISNYKIFSLPDPFRVVIDVRGEIKVTEEPSKISPQPPAQISSNSTTPAVVTQPAPEPIMIVLNDQKKTEVNGKEKDSNTKLNDGMKAIKISLAQQLGLGVRKIIVDPGHGGKDPGASAFGLNEKDIVLQISKKLAPILAKKTGAEVILTRDTDTYISLEERTAIANTQAADLFISLHINAHASPKVHVV